MPEVPVVTRKDSLEDLKAHKKAVSWLADVDRRATTVARQHPAFDADDQFYQDYIVRTRFAVSNLRNITTKRMQKLVEGAEIVMDEE